jgi:hypothetical protein
MSSLTYNGITLEFIRTNVLDRTARYSDDGVDYMWTDFTLDVISVFNPYGTSYNEFAEQEFGVMPEITDAAIRHYLLQNRQPLLFEEGGIVIAELESNLENGGAIDCDDGPKPINVSITRILGSKFFYVQYVIKFSLIECPDGSFPSPIASSRYSRAEQVDDQYRSTLTTSGVAYFRSNVLSSLAQNADYYRSYIIPPQLDGYKRSDIRVDIRSDGIMMTWSTTDIEQFTPLGNNADPGTPANIGITKMQLRYHAGTMTGGPNGMFGSFGNSVNVFCAAWGQKFVDRHQMMRLCMSVAINKAINLIGAGAIINKVELDEDCMEQYVSFSLGLFSLTDSTAEVPGVALPIYNIVGNQVDLAVFPNNALQDANLPSNDVNPYPPYDFSTRGSMGYQLAVNNFIEVCQATLDDFTGDDTGEQIPGTVYDQQTPFGNRPGVNQFGNAQISPPAIPPPIRDLGNSQRGANDSQALYMDYKTKSHNKLDSGVIQVPMATGVNNAPGQGPVGNGGGVTPTSVHIQLFQPFGQKEVKFSITRIGAIPETPDPTVPDSQSNNMDLLNQDVATMAVETMPDGVTLIFRVSGCYDYSYLQAPASTDPIQFDIPPCIMIAPSDTTQIQDEDYEDNIINNPPIGGSIGGSGGGLGV